MSLNSFLQKIQSIPLRRIARNTVVLIGNFLHWIIFHLLLPRRYRKATKTQIFDVIFKSDTPKGKAFDIILLIAIGINLFLMIIDSSPRITGWLSFALQCVEWLFTIGFTLEYYLRIYCLKNPRKYILSFYGIIDFLSIFPAYLSILFPATHTMSVLRILRGLRIFRILKMERFINEGRRLIRSLQRSAYKIAIFMVFTLLTSVILGAIMYMFENGRNEQFSSIPQGIYWAVVTITTVGYGDVTPVTHAGRFISIVVMLLGYSIIAVPTGIVAGETIKEANEARKERKRHREDIDDEEMAVLSTLEVAYDEDDEAEDEASVAPSSAERKEVVKRCPHCGFEEIDETATHCRHCGVRLTKIDERSWIDDFFA